MIQGKWFMPGQDISALIPVRMAVFDRGQDSLDSESWNALVFQDSVPVAAGRIYWSEGAFWISDLCVLEQYRGQRLGDLVLRLLLYKAQTHSAREVRLRCPSGITGFFSRLGLSPVTAEGSDIIEMMIPGDQIDLDTCSRCPKQNCPNRQPC